MKTTLHRFASVLLLAIASPAWAGATYLKATVTGTVQTAINLSATEQRIHTTKLNNQLIFDEYQVSPHDYELVSTVDGNAALALRPKSIAANLPTIVVVGIGTSASIVNTKTRVFKQRADIGPIPATNLFKDLAGEMAGTFTYKGPLQTLTYKKFVFTVTARATDSSPDGNGSALLAFKITAQGPFVQQP